MKREIPKCFYRVSVKALVFDESKEKFLIMKESSGVWDIPGGGLDWGESYKNELKREIREEMGLETEWISDKPSYFVTAKRGETDFWMANVIYEVKLKNLDFTPSDECVELKFVSKEEVQDYDVLENVTELAKFIS